jgi:hypothetical protein
VSNEIEKAALDVAANVVAGSLTPEQARRELEVLEYAKSWDEQSHPRETAAHDDRKPGEFAPKKEDHPDTVHPKDLALKAPKNRKDADSIGEFLRDQWVEYEGDDPDDSDHNRCRDATAMILAIFPDAEWYQGVIPGDWDEGGEHNIAKVGDWYIDLTSSQFGGYDFEVFDDKDMEPGGDHEQYGNFEPMPQWTRPQSHIEQYSTRAQNIVREWNNR